MKCLLTPRGASTACVCSPQQPAGSTAAKPAKSAMQWAELMAFLPHHLSQRWQGAKAPDFSVAPCPLHPWQMLPRRHHIGAFLPSSASNGLRGLPGPTEQSDFACPPPLPTNCWASGTCRGPRMGRAGAAHPCWVLPFAWGTAAALTPEDGLATDHRLRCCSLSQHTHGWSYDDFYQLEDKSLNVQFPALKALAFKDISNVGLSIKWMRGIRA